MTKPPVFCNMPNLFSLRGIVGRMAERSNAPDSKSGIRLYRIVGSNPTPSARFLVIGFFVPVMIPIEAPHSDRAAGLSLVKPPDRFLLAPPFSTMGAVSKSLSFVSHDSAAHH